MTIVEDARVITGGVDTHAGVHVAAALDRLGGLLGVREFPATAAGYASLLGWLSGFGPVGLAGVEGTGSYGAGLARYLAAAGVRVVEVDRPDRQGRRRAGKSDPLDAISAARAALSGRAAGAPRGRDGAVEAIRALMVARRSARAERTQAVNQARALLVTGPEELRARFARHTAARLLVAAGDHPGRLRSEAAWAHLCGAAPIPASSGKITRHRLNPGGDRQANHALWRIVITRMSSHPATRAYVERRSKQGLTKPEIIRCLKRYVARQVYPHLRGTG